MFVNISGIDWTHDHERFFSQVKDQKRWRKTMQWSSRRFFGVENLQWALTFVDTCVTCMLYQNWRKIWSETSQILNQKLKLAYTQIRLLLRKREWENILTIELKVPYDTLMVEAAQRKEAKYSELVLTVRKTGYRTNFVTLEFGSRGLPHTPGFHRLSISGCEYPRQHPKATHCIVCGKFTWT